MLSYLPGLWEKSKCSKYGEKNQPGPREIGLHFSLSPTAPALLQLRECREGEAGQCGWIQADAVAAWWEGFGAAGHNGGGSLVINRQQDPEETLTSARSNPDWEGLRASFPSETR